MKQEFVDSIRKAIDDGKALSEIAKNLYITEYQLKLLLRNWGIALPKKREYKRVPIPSREDLLERYAKHKTTEKVAISYDVGINTVNRWMKELRVPTRRMKAKDEKEKVKFLEEHLERLGDVQF